jgi:hypothetical protein
VRFGNAVCGIQPGKESEKRERRTKSFLQKPGTSRGAAVPFATRALKQRVRDPETTRNLFSRNIEK